MTISGVNLFVGPCGEDGGCAVMPGCDCPFDRAEMHPVHDLPDVCGDCGSTWNTCACPFTPTDADDRGAVIPVPDTNVTGTAPHLR